MPELPEVEHASRKARRAAVGQVIARVEVRHAAQRRGLSPRTARSLVGDMVLRVTRRAKYQVFHLASGRALVVHFRMTGDWEVARAGEALPPHARFVMHFIGGRTLVLTDPRALSTVHVVAAGESPVPALGPEATDRSFSPAYLVGVLERRTGAIKLALLDQRVVAGIGNIYASEALWLARLDPARRARSLSVEEARRLVAGVRRVMAKAIATPARYYQDGTDHLRFNVYDREGRGCRRCRTPISRVVQGGRSTYWCPVCQR